MDSKSIVFKYIKEKNKHSVIDAEFVIIVTLNHIINGLLKPITYYVFFKKRNREVSYRLVSFFRKNEKNNYTGDRANCVYKEKIDNLNLTNELLINKTKKESEET